MERSNSHTSPYSKTKVNPTTADSSSWTATPNTTASGSTTTPAWSGMSLAVPPPGSTEHDVVLVNSTPATDRLSTSFSLFGTFVFREGSDGFQDLWYAVPAGSVPDLYFLRWNETEAESGAVSVTLRRTSPGTPAALLAEE